MNQIQIFLVVESIPHTFSGAVTLFICTVIAGLCIQDSDNVGYCWIFPSSQMQPTFVSIFFTPLSTARSHKIYLFAYFSGSSLKLQFIWQALLIIGSVH